MSEHSIDLTLVDHSNKGKGMSPEEFKKYITGRLETDGIDVYIVSIEPFWPEDNFDDANDLHADIPTCMLTDGAESPTQLPEALEGN